MNGPELAERITQLRPEIKVLFVSGYSENALTRNGLLSRRFLQLHKPFALETLVLRLRGLLESPPASASDHAAGTS
jgi:hypothetical protein